MLSLTLEKLSREPLGELSLLTKPAGEQGLGQSVVLALDGVLFYTQFSH